MLSAHPSVDHIRDRILHTPQEDDFIWQFPLPGKSMVLGCIALRKKSKISRITFFFFLAVTTASQVPGQGSNPNQRVTIPDL